MLGHDVAAALPEMRAHAESLMVDACTVTGPGGEPVWDEDAGEYTTPAGAVIYTGKCRVQVPNVAEQNADAGEAEWTVQAAIVSLPVGGSEGVQVGHKVTIPAAAHDSALAGAVYTVTAGHAKTQATARRLRCERVV